MTVFCATSTTLLTVTFTYYIISARDNKFFTVKKKVLTKAIAIDLLKKGKASLTGCYSQKTGKTYDAVILLDDTGSQFVNFTMEFPTKKGR